MPAWTRVSPALQAALGATIMLAGCAAFALAHVEHAPTHALDPVALEVASVDAGGGRTDTGIRSLSVLTGVAGTVVIDPPAPLARLAQWAWSHRVSFASGAGDVPSEQSRTNAWTAARELAGLPAIRGLMVTAGARAPLRDGDVIVPGDPRATTLPSGPIADLVTGSTVTVLRDAQRLPLALPPSYDLGTARLAVTGGTPGAPVIPGTIGHQGSSAGVAMALAYLQALTGGDLTGGRTVAATGTLTATPYRTWRVEPVGSAGQKARAAVRAGVDVLLVPHRNGAVARAAARGSATTVVTITRLEQAVGWLCLTGGTGSACQRWADRRTPVDRSPAGR